VFLPAIGTGLVTIILKWLDSRGVLRKLAHDEATTLRAELRAELREEREERRRAELREESWRSKAMDALADAAKANQAVLVLNGEVERLGRLVQDLQTVVGADRRHSDADRAAPLDVHIEAGSTYHAPEDVEE
jgi:hypothetical protein